MSVQVPLKWLNFIKRILGLRQGKWVIALTVTDEGCAYEVAEMGKIEK